MRFGLAGSIIVLSALLPMEALALECVPYHVRAAFWAYADNPETYLLVFGRLDDLRPAHPGSKAQADHYLARFTGFAASRRAIDNSFEADAAVDFSELRLLTGETGLAPDAAAEASGKSGLIWLEKTDAGYSASYSLCWPLVDTDPASIKPALRCLRGGYCPSPKP